MRKEFLATAAFGLLALPAMAADLAPVYNAGGTWSTSNSVNVNSSVAQDFDPNADSLAVASAAAEAGWWSNWV